MADSKYGQLYTAGDMIRFAESMVRSGTVADERTLREELTEFEGFRFPADEPLFLLRGQDKAAPLAIGQPNAPSGTDYATSASLHGASDEHVASALNAAERMREWQAANPDRVKIPDR